MKKGTAVIMGLMLIFTSILTSCLADAGFITEHQSADGYTDGYAYYTETSREGDLFVNTGDGAGLLELDMFYQTFSENLTYITNMSAHLATLSKEIYVKGGIHDGSAWVSSETLKLNLSGYTWVNFNISSEVLERNKQYQFKVQVVGGNASTCLWAFLPDTYANGTAHWHAGTDYAFKIYGVNSTFKVNRTIVGTTEFNNLTCTADYHYNYTSFLGLDWGTLLIVPVSEDVLAITEVRNLTGAPPITPATEVANPVDLISNTYYFEPSSRRVFIHRGGNISIGDDLDWHVNATRSGYTLYHNPPEFLEVGDYWQCTGLIINESSGNPFNTITSTYIVYENGTTALGPFLWNCTDGDYYCVMSTTPLRPGIYGVNVEYTVDGITYKHGSVLYLSWAPGAGVYSDAILDINWYNTNYGLGLPEETLQLFINENRQRSLTYYTYIGEHVNITIRDYYNFTLLQYNFTINNTYEFLDLGLTFHEYDFSNYNNEYYVVALLKDGATRWFERILPAYGQQEFLIPTGNYTIRVYNADNSSYVSWAETVNNSRGYLIEGDNITLVIEGLDIIDGDLLEINHILIRTLIGDVLVKCTNPPIILKTKGRAYLSDGIYKICPPQIVRATTRNATLEQNISSIPVVPLNDTFVNGTITILEDTIYFAGVADWVNITFTDNGTLYQNTSYVPNHINVYGQNFTINASATILVTRETRFHQLTMFYWTYDSNNGKYDVVIYVNNSLNTPLYEVEVDVGFANNTIPDQHSVKMFDIQNGGEELDEMENFFVDASGIHFDFLSLNATAERSFNVEYYRDDDDPSNVRYSDEIVEIKGHETYIEFPGTDDRYNRIFISWANVETTIFRGNLIVKLMFDMETDIDAMSLRLWDMNTDTEVDGSDFAYYGNSIVITSNAVGTVSPGSAKKFHAYFTMEDWGRFQPDKNTLNTRIAGTVFSIMNIVTLLSFGMITVGVLLFATKKKRQSVNNIRNAKFLITVGIFIFVIFFILQNQV